MEENLPLFFKKHWESSEKYMPVISQHILDESFDDFKKEIVISKDITKDHID